MDQASNHKPVKLNLDKSRKSILESESFYLLNNDSANSITALGKSTPLAANKTFCELSVDGDIYPVGEWKDERSNRIFAAYWSSTGQHFINIVNADGCEIILPKKGCFDINLDPKHVWKKGRVWLDKEQICKNRHGERLMWAIGTEQIGCIDIGAALATVNPSTGESFSTPFFDRCADECAPYLLCVPKPCGCIEGEWEPLAQSPIESALTNKTLDIAFQLAFQGVYYDEREGDVSDPSKTFYQDSRGCFDNSEGYPRCWKATIPLGNPLIDKIRILKTTNNGLTWELHDTVEKYESYTSSKQYWYERGINIELDLTPDGCSFYYFFCNDKQCTTYEKTDALRTNQLPRFAQGLIPIKNSIAPYNYVTGNCPLPQAEIDKFLVTKKCIAADCEPLYVEVPIYAVIHNFDLNNNTGAIHRDGGNKGDADDPTTTAHFGLGDYSSWLNQMGQTFQGARRNFQIYVEGAEEYTVIMEQWKYDKIRNIHTQVGVLAEGDLATYADWITNQNGFYYQKGTLRVKYGASGFIRIDSHLNQSLDSDTSTFVRGTINFSNYAVGGAGSGNVSTLNSTAKEVPFDTCNPTDGLDRIFVVADYGYTSSADEEAVFSGYISDKSGRITEGIPVYNESNALVGISDYNGFYHFSAHVDSGHLTTPYPIKFKAEQDCSAFSDIESIQVTWANKLDNKKNVSISDNTYDNDFFAEVPVKVENCEGVGIEGIRVAISGGKARASDQNGNIIFRIRNYYTRDRIINLSLMDEGECFLLDCQSQCYSCLPTSQHSTPACYVHISGAPLIDSSLFTVNAEALVASRNGLKKGGIYDFGIVAKGRCGQQSAAYFTDNIIIPKLQENGINAFCTFLYNGTGMKLPDWVDCLEIVRSENLNPYELQWVIDKAVATPDGKIKITIQSLNDYNSNYLDKTNTIYHALPNDRVEFIRKGDGSLFSIIQYGSLLNYQIISPGTDATLTHSADADFFNQILIIDDNRIDIDDLQGAVIEFQRAKECKDEFPVYYGICVSLEVEQVDDGQGGTYGQIANSTGAFTTFDTFLVRRQIANFPPQVFEHKYPSDFWSYVVPEGEAANGVSDTGKPYFANPYENERRYGRNFTISASVPINRFGDTVKTLDGLEQGDITLANIEDGKVILAICEHDSATLSVDDTLLRSGADGIVRANPADNIISDIQAQLQGQYGCQYEDIGIVFFGIAYALYVDSKKQRPIIHNYQYARVAGEGIVGDKIVSQMNSYFLRILQNKKKVNAALGDDYEKHLRFYSGIETVAQTIYITIKAFTDESINNSRKPYQKQNETLRYNPATDEFMTFASFTADAYSTIDLHNDEGSRMIMFLKGDVYNVPVIPTEYNRWFGVACDLRWGIVVNKFAEKIKRVIASEEQSDKPFFVEEITTDKPNYLSEVPASRVSKWEDVYKFSYLGNINGKGLYNNETPRGFAISVLLCRDNTQVNAAGQSIYGSIDPAKQIEYSEIDSIFTKFSLSESSGFTENL